MEIPKGWRLVPEEPTIAMIKALAASWTDPQKDNSIALWAAGTFREDYQAMLAAAPQPDH